MSYAADHLAWQQRVNQEFNAAARFMDRTYTHKMTTGNPVGFPSMYPGNTMYAPKMTTGYVAKSRLAGGSSAASVRSKSMRSGLSRTSHLSRKKQSKRFNEELDVVSRSSKQKPHNFAAHKQQVTKTKPVTEEKKQLIEKINKLDENKLEKLAQKQHLEQQPSKQGPSNYQERRDEEEREQYEDDDGRVNQAETEEDAKAREEQDLHDEIDSLYYGSSYSQADSKASRMTSATYISKLEKELLEERKAREKLAQELEEIKKLSSEISSHLGLNKQGNEK